MMDAVEIPEADALVTELCKGDGEPHAATGTCPCCGGRYCDGHFILHNIRLFSVTPNG